MASPSRRGGASIATIVGDAAAANMLPSTNNTAQWFRLSPTKRPTVSSYDGTRSINKSRFPGVDAGGRWEHVRESAARKAVVHREEWSSPVSRWGRGADGRLGSNQKDWQRSKPSDWFRWTAVLETRPRPAETDLEGPLPNAPHVFSDEEVMQQLMGPNPPAPAIASCLSATYPFAGITWDANDVETVRRDRYVQRRAASLAHLM
jgi:hypothetical protein